MKRILTIAAIALLLSVGASDAKAATIAELQAMIASLTQQLAALSGGSTMSSGYAFNTNLTVGSTGADVVALQDWLASKGFLSIPAGTSKGYFGQLTKSSVASYQASVGLPSTGFVGALTRAKLNASGSVVVTPTPGTPTTPVVGLDNTDGSITASLSSYVGTGTTIKKGETKDMIAVKLQATAGKVAISRFDVRFDQRPWLYYSKITLKDTDGNVIATKNISSAADATEITVGSDYLVRFENVNTVVTPNIDKILVVSGTVLTTTDKLTSNVSVVVSVPSNSIRTTNGQGYTDSLGDSTFTRTVTLSSSGSVADINVRISPNTPVQRIVTTSTSGQTNDVVLGVFDFKSKNNSSTINTLKFALKNNNGTTFSTMYKNLRLYDGSTVYNVDSVAATSTFSNLTINLPEDEWKSLTLKADVADQDDFTNGTIASTTIFVHNTSIIGIDSNYTTVTATSVNNVTTNETTFLQNGGTVTNTSASYSVIDNGSTPVAASVKVGFTFNNTGSNDLYISKTAGLALATTSTIATAASSTLTLIQTTPSTVAGDTSTVYVIPSGTSRTFTIDGAINNKNGTQALQEFKVTKIYFADDTTNVQEFNVNFGLENLRVTPTI
jgi:peptidoglycan hydrolase-like protein with peptidoglycan-binding domain